MGSLTPHPILFQVGGLAITSHGFFFAVGAEAGYLVLLWLARKSGLPTAALAEKCLLVFVAGLAAARIGFFLIYPSAYQSILQVLSIWQGGLVSFFGILGGLAAAYALFPKERGRWLGLVAVAALVAWGIGRVGNFLAGDSVGMLSAHWLFFYGRVPIQLFESVFCLAAGFFWMRRFRQPLLLAWVLLTYLGIRFLVDFWRDERSWGLLHLGQWACLLLGIPLTIYLVRKR